MDIVNLLSRLSEAGLTQAEIGRAIGRSQSVVSDMAQGKIGVKRPSHEVVEGLERLAESYGLRARTEDDSPRRRKSDLKRRN